MRKRVNNEYEKAKAEIMKKVDGVRCCICGKILPEDRDEYCSTECLINWLRSIPITWSDLRKKAFERDNYTCAMCGKKYPENRLIGDHIKPIVLGGDEFNLDNIQTLCGHCNRIKTIREQKN